MRLLNAYPADFVFEIELRKPEVEKLVKALDRAEIAYKGDDPAEKEAVEFLTQIFYPALTGFLEVSKDVS